MTTIIAQADSEEKSGSQIALSEQNEPAIKEDKETPDKELELKVSTMTKPTTVVAISEMGFSSDESDRQESAPATKLSVRENISKIPKTQLQF